MPDDDNTMMEVEETESSETSKGSSPIVKYGIYAAIVIVMVMAAWFVTLKVVKPMFAGGDEAAEVAEDESKSGHEEQAEESEDSHASTERDSHSSGSEDEDYGDVPDSDIYLINEIIVNPAGTGGTRFLSTSIGFELKSAKAGKLFRERDAVVRDALITILSSQSVPQLSDFKQRERLRKLIKLRVQKLLKTDDIEAVYFTEFAMQ
ncbi:MAG: flagellar basal body-associated FliL family protein [candidate division Zixibacteria bacterium]